MVVEASGFVLRRNWILVGATLAVGVAALLFTRTHGFWAPFGWFLSAIAFFFAPLFVVRNAFPRAIPARLHATAAGLAVEGHGDVRSEDILEAKLVPRKGYEAVVELALRTAQKKLVMRTGYPHARAIVDLLGARRSRFRLVIPYGLRYLASLVVLVGVSLLLTLGARDAWLVAILPSIFYAFFAAWLLGFARGRLVVGADGYTTRWLFFRERFVPFRDVAAVTGSGQIGTQGLQDTLVQLKSGRKVRLRTVEAPNTEEERGAEGHAMLVHLGEAFARAARLHDGGVDVPALVARGARSAREWLMGIDALVRGGGSQYRVAAVSPDTLSALATDPSATVEARAGAAAALVRMGDEGLRVRVRVSAAACAEPELRATLLALADARDDVAAEAALTHVLRR